MGGCSSRASAGIPAGAEQLRSLSAALRITSYAFIRVLALVDWNVACSRVLSELEPGLFVALDFSYRQLSSGEFVDRRFFMADRNYPRIKHNKHEHVRPDRYHLIEQ